MEYLPIWGHEANINEFWKIDILYGMFFDYSEINLDTNFFNY